MSKSSVSALKSQVNSLEKTVNSCSSAMGEINGKIYSAMNDTVGQSASESIKSIKTSFDYSYDKGLKAIKTVADEMSRGYDQIKIFGENAASLIRQAEDLKGGLGSI